MPKKITTDSFIIESKKVHCDRFDYSFTKYVNAKTKVKIVCKNHGIFVVLPYDHIKGKGGCPICRNKFISQKHQYDNEIFIKKANKIHKNKYDYFLTEYENYKTKIKISCPKHGVFEQIPYYHLLGSGCPNCCTSKGELKIRDFLNKNKIKYIGQHIFKGCEYKKLLRFDFYLPDYNICIEYDGKQHHQPIKAWGGEEVFNIVKKRDEIKSKFCLNEKITLIRISYNDERSLEEIFKNYF
jgi:hypothetical protein